MQYPLKNRPTSECEFSLILQIPRATGGARFSELTPNDSLLSMKSYMHRTPLIFNQEGTNLRLFRVPSPRVGPVLNVF